MGGLLPITGVNNGLFPKGFFLNKIYSNETKNMNHLRIDLKPETSGGTFIINISRAGVIDGIILTANISGDSTVVSKCQVFITGYGQSVNIVKARFMQDNSTRARFIDIELSDGYYIGPVTVFSLLGIMTDFNLGESSLEGDYTIVNGDIINLINSN